MKIGNVFKWIESQGGKSAKVLDQKITISGTAKNHKISVQSDSYKQVQFPFGKNEQCVATAIKISSKEGKILPIVIMHCKGIVPLTIVDKYGDGKLTIEEQNNSMCNVNGKPCSSNGRKLSGLQNAYSHFIKAMKKYGEPVSADTSMKASGIDKSGVKSELKEWKAQHNAEMENWKAQHNTEMENWKTQHNTEVENWLNRNDDKEKKKKGDNFINEKIKEADDFINKKEKEANDFINEKKESQ